MTVVAKVKINSVNPDGTVTLGIAFPDGRRQQATLNDKQVLDINIEPKKDTTPGESGSVPGFKAVHGE